MAAPMLLALRLVDTSTGDTATTVDADDDVDCKVDDELNADVVVIAAVVVVVIAAVVVVASIVDDDDDDDVDDVVAVDDDCDEKSGHGFAYAVEP
jgi:hypothetical protein